MSLTKFGDIVIVVVQEIGETIRTIIETVGNIIITIIQELSTLIPTLADTIISFIERLGPAIKTCAEGIMDTITEVINFLISGVEYVVNTLIIGAINKLLEAVNIIPGVDIDTIENVSIPRFEPDYKIASYDTGTNYVPNDGLAYLHQGEAVVPKKYNENIGTQLTSQEKTYMAQMVSTMKSLDTTIKQGISVNGQFTQKGSDLVAVVNKVSARKGTTVLSNPNYAR